MTNEDLLIGVAAAIGLCPALFVGALIRYTYLREKIAQRRKPSNTHTHTIVKSTMVCFNLPSHLYGIAESLCEKNYKESGTQWTVDDLCQRLLNEELRRVRDKAPEFKEQP